MVGESLIIYLTYIFLILQSPLVNCKIFYKVMVEEDIIRIHSKSCTDETAVLPTVCKKDLTYIGDASCTFKELNGTGRFILKDAVVNLTTKSNFTYFYWYIHKKWHFLKISLFNGSCNVWVIEQQLKTSEAKVCLDKLSQNVVNEQFPQKNISSEKERHRDRYRIMVDNENILTHLITCKDKTSVIPSMCKKDLTYIADDSCPFKELNDVSKFTLKDGFVNLITKLNFTYLYWYMFKKWYFFKTNLFNSSCNVWVIDQPLKTSYAKMCLDKLSENQRDEQLPRKNIPNKKEIHRDRYKIMIDKENILIHSLSCKYKSTIPSVCKKDLKYLGDASCPFNELNGIQNFTLKDDIVHSTTKSNFTYLYWYINKNWYFLKTGLFNSSCNIWVIEQQLKSSEVELCLDKLSENLEQISPDEQVSPKNISNEGEVHRDDANTEGSSVSKLIYTKTTAKNNLVSSTSAPRSIKETTDKNWLKGVIILTVVTLLFLVLFLLVLCTLTICLGYAIWKRNIGMDHKITSGNDNLLCEEHNYLQLILHLKMLNE